MLLNIPLEQTITRKPQGLWQMFIHHNVPIKTFLQREGEGGGRVVVVVVLVVGQRQTQSSSSQQPSRDKAWRSDSGYGFMSLVRAPSIPEKRSAYTSLQHPPLHPSQSLRFDRPGRRHRGAQRGVWDNHESSQVFCYNNNHTIILNVDGEWGLKRRIFIANALS